MKGPKSSRATEVGPEGHEELSPQTGGSQVSHPIFSFFHTLATKYSLIVVLAATLLAGAGGYLYFFELKIVTDRSQLVNKELEANRSYQRYLKEFGDDSFLALVISTTATGTDGMPKHPTPRQRAGMKQIVDRWTEQTRTRPDLLPKVIDRVEWPSSSSLAPLYVPLSDLHAMAAGFEKALPSLSEWSQSPSLEALLTLANKQFGRLPAETDTSTMALLLPHVELFFQWLRLNIAEESSQPLDTDQLTNLTLSLAGPAGMDAEGYFFSEDSRILTAYATVIGDASAKNQFAKPLEFAQNTLDDILADDALSDDLAAGFAGMPALEYEEMLTSEQDFARTTALALGAVTVLFVIGFGSLARPALGALCLAISIGATFGFVWLVIGHLNLLAMVFAVILVALGVDFAIHFLTHYEDGITTGEAPKAAIMRAYQSVGGALIMGGVTTAVAFLSACFADFAGLAELGLIAGAGLLMSLLVILVVYPAMLYLADTHFARASRGTRLQRFAKSLVPGALRSGSATKRKAILSTSFILMVAGLSLGQYQFDTNLLNLQALDGNISRWQKLLFDVDDRTTFAISTFADRQSLEKIRRAFTDRPDIVRRTESLFPEDEAEKRRVLGRLRSQIASLDTRKQVRSSPFAVKRQLWSLRQTIRKYQTANATAKTALANLRDQVDGLYRVLNQLASDLIPYRLGQIDRHLADATGTLLTRVGEYLALPDFSEQGVPGVLRDRFLGSNGTHALLVYPSKNTWERDNLEEFVTEARTIDPDIFGEIVALHENGRSLVRSFLQSAVAALVSILVLLLVWTRSIRTTGLALIPLVVSVGLLLGIMKYAPRAQTWNFANFFAIPILVGIGVDSGIHLVHAWQRNGRDVFQNAAKAVLYSSLTTMIGFGILATSRHAGIASLGYVLLVGIGMCLAASFTTLPAALSSVHGSKRSA
jgi:hopanoid biosynthesis associated RND transporter like protein HpnN